MPDDAEPVAEDTGAPASSSAPSSETETVILSSSDGMTFEVRTMAARRLGTVKCMIEDMVDVSGGIPLTNVTGAVLAKVLEHCDYHCDLPYEEKKEEEKVSLDNWSTTKKELPEIIPWDLIFMEVDQPMLYELIVAANYLDAKELMALACRTMADMMRGKKAEKIREIFNIKCDFTPEEVEQIRVNSQWASSE